MGLKNSPTCSSCQRRKRRQWGDQHFLVSTPSTTSPDSNQTCFSKGRPEAQEGSPYSFPTPFPKSSLPGPDGKGIQKSINSTSVENRSPVPQLQPRRPAAWALPPSKTRKEAANGTNSCPGIGNPSRPRGLGTSLKNYNRPADPVNRAHPSPSLPPYGAL